MPSLETKKRYPNWRSRTDVPALETKEVPSSEVKNFCNSCHLNSFTGVLKQIRNIIHPCSSFYCIFDISYDCPEPTISDILNMICYNLLNTIC